MVLYARSDVVGVAVPADNGGCGEFHSRPVVNGAPAKLFGIDCPQCEHYLKTHNHDQWTTNRWDIPLTEDEKLQAEMLEKRAQAIREQESDHRAQYLARELAAESNGVYDEVEPHIVRREETPPESARNSTPSRRTSEELARQDAETERFLSGLSFAELRARCKELGIPAGGGREVLIDRLRGKPV